MNAVPVTIRMFNFITKEKIGYTKYVTIGFDFQSYAQELSDVYPDYNIQVKWQISEIKYINLPPKNQIVDDLKYRNGEITWKEYSDKWLVSLSEAQGLKITKDE